MIASEIDPTMIPARLTERVQWVVWCAEHGTKVPYNARTGGKASTTDPTTWSMYSVALAAAKKGNYNGIGYVFAKDDPFIGIDLDNCIDEREQVAPWADRIVKEQHSYSEVSPSGHGIKIWIEGEITRSIKALGSKVPPAIKPADMPGGIEIYGEGRYFTMTGWHVNGTPREICNSNGALTALVEALQPPAPAPPPARTHTSRPVGHAYLERWANYKFDYARERVRQAIDGEKHNERYKMAKLLGGLIPHGLASAEDIATLLFDANPPRTEAARSEYKTLLDGARDGSAAALDLPDEPPQPIYDSAGFACCPLHSTRLVLANSGNGYTCHLRDSSTANGWCKFWWDGEGYTQPVEANDTDDDFAPDQSTASVPGQTESAIILERLRTLGYTFRLNLCTDTVEVNQRALSDILAAKIRMDLRDIGLTKKIRAAEDAYVAEAEKNAYHPVRDYLNDLKWDEHDHIYAVAACIESDDPPILYTDGTQRPLHAVYLRRWLIGAVAKALDGKQNPMLVLDGAQGCGKSTFVKWLCSGLPGYFIEGAINVQDKDSDVRLISRWIWEVSELDATTRKADQSALKAFITKEIVSVRKAYGRHDIIKPGLASLIGTVNNTSGFLADESGSRRFMITHLTAISWNYTALDINQVWAQAVALYKSGERWMLAGVETQAQRNANERYEVDTVLDDWIERSFMFEPGLTEPVSLADILIALAVDDVRLSGSERMQAAELARTLVRHGAKRIHTRIGKRWIGLRKC